MGRPPCLDRKTSPAPRSLLGAVSRDRGRISPRPKEDSGEGRGEEGLTAAFGVGYFAKKPIEAARRPPRGGTMQPASSGACGVKPRFILAGDRP